MRRFVLLVVAALALGPTAPAAAADVAIADLVTDSASFDESIAGEITIEGELVGDFQRRSTGVWVQVNGDAYAERALLDGGDHAGSNIGIGARIPTDLFDALEVETPGGYRVRGAVVTLTGEWHHHDEARGGESWFEVSAAEVVRPEHHLDEPMSWVVMGAGLVLLAAAGAIALVSRGDQR